MTPFKLSMWDQPPSSRKSPSATPSGHDQLSPFRKSAVSPGASSSSKVIPIPVVEKPVHVEPSPVLKDETPSPVWTFLSHEERLARCLSRLTPHGQEIVLEALKPILSDDDYLTLDEARELRQRALEVIVDSYEPHPGMMAMRPDLPMHTLKAWSHQADRDRLGDLPWRSRPVVRTAPAAPKFGTSTSALFVEPVKRRKLPASR